MTCPFCKIDFGGLVHTCNWSAPSGESPNVGNVQFFKREDFANTERFCRDNHPSRLSTTEIILSAVNEANRILAERGVRVWGFVKEGTPSYWGPHENGKFDDTHTALLIDIRPLEKPDTAEAIATDLALWAKGANGDGGGRVFDLPTIVERARRLLERK
jgi:hypothetical protein